jgi:hypothetical protein
VVALVAGLVGAELLAVAVVAYLYHRRRRTVRAAEAIAQIDELVFQAVRLGTRARDPRLSLAQRAGLLHDTHEALDEALALLRSLPKHRATPLEPGGAKELPAPEGDRRAA